MRRILAAFCFLTLALMARDSAPIAGLETSASLHEGWSIQESAQIKATGAEISQPGFAVTSWYPARVPCTVLGALMDDGVYNDSFFGKNLVGIQKEPFHGSWWYRTEFNAGGKRDGLYTRLQFDGPSLGFGACSISTSLPS
jgi:exo-1,4-beta-D-glucosaminidase